MQNIKHELFLEADDIAQRVWGWTLSKGMGDRYVATLLHYEGPSVAPLPPWLSRVADWEAVEFFLRVTSPGNPLSRRASVMAFLLEADPRHFEDFVNDRNRRVAAWVSILAEGLRSLVMLLKGGCLTLLRRV